MLLKDNTLFDSAQRGELQDLFFVLLDVDDNVTGTFLNRRVLYRAYRDSGHVISPKHLNSCVIIQIFTLKAH